MFIKTCSEKKAVFPTLELGLYMGFIGDLMKDFAPVVGNVCYAMVEVKSPEFPIYPRTVGVRHTIDIQLTSVNLIISIIRVCPLYLFL